MTKTKVAVVGLLLILAITCLGTVIAAKQANLFRRLYDDLVLDNRGHYLSCDELPSETQVRAVLEGHQDTIRTIEEVNPGLVGVDIDTWTCPGKADLIIWYATHQNRLEIEKIISHDTFFGVPYRLENH